MTPRTTSSAGRTAPALYRVQYHDRPGAYIHPEWQDYVPKDLPAAEAMELRAEAERRYGGRWEFRTVEMTGATVPARQPYPMTKVERRIVKCAAIRAEHHGASQVLLNRDRHGRLVVKMGGAR